MAVPANTLIHGCSDAFIHRVGNARVIRSLTGHHVSLCYLLRPNHLSTSWDSLSSYHYADYIPITSAALLVSPLGHLVCRSARGGYFGTLLSSTTSLTIASSIRMFVTCGIFVAYVIAVPPLHDVYFNRWCHCMSFGCVNEDKCRYSYEAT
jgi:hypothetical protein